MGRCYGPNCSIEYIIEVKRLGPVNIPNFDRFFCDPFFKSEFLHHTELIHLGIMRKMSFISIRLKSFAREIVTFVTELYPLFNNALKNLALLARLEELYPAFLGFASFARCLLLRNA